MKGEDVYRHWRKIKDDPGLIRLREELEQKTGLKVSPWVIFAKGKKIQKLIRSTVGAVGAFQTVLKQYWRELPENGPAVSLLEQGVSDHWRRACRISRRAPITLLDFDFQSGGLIELNSNPPLPWLASQLQKATAKLVSVLGARPACRELESNQVGAVLWPYLKHFPKGRLAVVSNSWWVDFLTEALKGYKVENFTSPLEALGNCEVLWLPPVLKRSEALELTEAFVGGEVDLFPHPQLRLLSSKNLLALLSNPEERTQLNANRLGSLKQHLLWTRVLTEEVSGTIELLQRHGVGVVVKAFETSGSRQTEMRKVLQAARSMPGRGVAQEYAPPYEIPGTGLKYDLRIQYMGGRIFVNARVFAGEKMNLSHLESGTVPVFMI